MINLEKRLKQHVNDVFWYQYLLKDKVDLLKLEQLHQPNQIYKMTNDYDRIRTLYHYRRALLEEFRRVYLK